MTFAIGIVVLLVIMFVIAGVFTGLGVLLHDAVDLDRIEQNGAPKLG